MRSTPAVLVLTLTAAATLAAAPAHADLEHKLEQARAERRAALERVNRLEDRLDELLARFERVQAKAGHAAIRLLDRSRAVEVAEEASAEARTRMHERVRTAYEVGPASILQAYLSARTFADLSVAHEYTARTLTYDARTLDALRSAEAALVARRHAAERADARLSAQRGNLRTLLDDMRATLDRTRRIADRFGLVVRRLEAQQLAVDEAAASARSASVRRGPISPRCSRSSARRVAERARRRPGSPTPGRASRGTRAGTGGTSPARRRRTAPSSTHVCSPPRTGGCRSARSSGSATGAGARSSS
jgi:peptidoglycan hydrolase CwlO-like protein